MGEGVGHGLHRLAKGGRLGAVDRLVVSHRVARGNDEVAESVGKRPRRRQQRQLVVLVFEHGGAQLGQRQERLRRVGRRLGGSRQRLLVTGAGKLGGGIAGGRQRLGRATGHVSKRDAAVVRDLLRGHLPGDSTRAKAKGRRREDERAGYKAKKNKQNKQKQTKTKPKLLQQRKE